MSNEGIWHYDQKKVVYINRDSISEPTLPLKIFPRNGICPECQIEVGEEVALDRDSTGLICNFHPSCVKSLK